MKHVLSGLTGTDSIVNLRLGGVDGEAVLHGLDTLGITVSTGSACSAASPGPSHVLMALGLSPEQAHASVRFSLGEATTDGDVDAVIAAVPRVIESLRALDRGARWQDDANTTANRVAGRPA